MKAAAAISSAKETTAARSPVKAKENQAQTAAALNLTVIPDVVPVLQRKSFCPCDGGCPSCLGDIQPKLTIGQPDDEYEQEADRVADQVMRMPESEVQRKTDCSSCDDVKEEQIQTKAIGNQITQLVQRQLEEETEEEEEEEFVQASTLRNKSPPLAAGTGLQDHILSLRGGGQPLSADTCAFFQPRFGHDFSDVRVHTGSRAAQAAQAIGARAFTLGNDIVFNDGEYTPHRHSSRLLLAHELVHTIQQGSQKDVIHRYSWDEFFEDTGIAAAEEALSDAGEAIYDVGESAVEFGIDVGERVYEFGAEIVEEAGEVLVRVGETVLSVAAEVWQTARRLAALFGVSVSISGGRLVINVPPLSLCPTFRERFSLGELSHFFPFLVGYIPLTGIVNLYGALGITVAIAPEVAMDLGPCELHGMRIVIDPLGGNASANFSLTVSAALGLGAEVRGGGGAEVGVLLIIPSEPPIPIHIPAVGAEIGLAGLFLGSGAATLTSAHSLSFRGGSFSYRTSNSMSISLAAALGFGAYAQLSVIGQNLCRLYWPLWNWNGEMGADIDLDAVVDIGPGGPSVGISVDATQLTQAPYDQLPMGLDPALLTDECPLCDALYKIGLMPSQNGGAWSGHPAPLWPGPLRVFPKDPGIPSGAKCRGACGPDCDYCSEPEDKVECEPVGDRHVYWTYPNYVECGSHQGCRDHDACYDWCAAIGESTIWGPCHRVCDFECFCSYNAPQCVGWITGGHPHDRDMVFSDRPYISSGCRGPCPEEVEDEEGGSSGFLLCLPEVIMFDRRTIGDSIEHELPEITVWQTEIWVPQLLSLVILEVTASGSLNGALQAGLGPARFTNLCFDVDPKNGTYEGHGELRVPADLTGELTLRGALAADASWFGIIEVVRAEGGLEAIGRGALTTELVGAVQVTCENGEPTTKTSLTLPTCLDLNFDLDATFDLELVSFNLLSKRWNVFGRQWNKCWGEDSIIEPITAGREPDLDLRSHTINLEKLLRWIFTPRGPDEPPPQLPPGGGGPPTGRDRSDPIEMTWYKPKSEYPQTVNLAEEQGATCTGDADCSAPVPTCTPLYIGRRWRDRCTRNRDFPLDQHSNLPALTGRQQDVTIGVLYYPDAGDIVELDPTPRSGNPQRNFNNRFARHGHRLQDNSEQPDHVLDLDWNGADHFSNLWPLDADLNMEAGRVQNLQQQVTFSEGPQGPVHTDVTMREFKRQDFHRQRSTGDPERDRPHRYFRIALVRIP